MKKISVLFVKFAREEKKESTSLKLVGVWNGRNKNRNNIQLENWYICSRNTLCYHQSVYNNVLKFIQFLELQISLDYLFLLNYNSPFFFLISIEIVFRANIAATFSLYTIIPRSTKKKEKSFHVNVRFFHSILRLPNRNYRFYRSYIYIYII